MNDYTHLVYVRRYSIISDDYELYVYGVNTTDIFHTIGEMHYRSLEHIKRIDFVELTPENMQAKLDFWKDENKKIIPWYDKYEKKQERGTGCDFCCNGYHLSMKDMYGERVETNFCPKCGRVLK